MKEQVLFCEYNSQTISEENLATEFKLKFIADCNSLDNF